MNIWLYLYLAIGFFVYLATLMALRNQKKLRASDGLGVIAVGLLLIPCWPAFAIYRYCL